MKNLLGPQTPCRTNKTKMFSGAIQNAILELRGPAYDKQRGNKTLKHHAVRKITKGFCDKNHVSYYVTKLTNILSMSKNKRHILPFIRKK